MNQQQIYINLHRTNTIRFKKQWKPSQIRTTSAEINMEQLKKQYQPTQNEPKPSRIKAEST